jgi:hypothetical protein
MVTPSSALGVTFSGTRDGARCNWSCHDGEEAIVFEFLLFEIYFKHLKAKISACDIKWKKLVVMNVPSPQ